MNSSLVVNSVKIEDYEIGKLPDELVQTPLPVIFFAGLNVVQNPVHNNVWTSFSSKKASDRPPAHYRLMSSDCVIPPSRPKVTLSM